MPFPKTNFPLLKLFTICIFITTGILISGCSTEKENHVPGNTRLSDNKIEVRGSWARPASQGMMGGGYMTILNGTNTADTLVRISTPVAEAAEVHESYQEDGLSGMRPAGTLAIESQSALELKPGGYHLMLMQLRQNLAAGDTVAATLFFARSDSLTIQIPVRKSPPPERF